jgi:predicted component of type VI protein secretion system
LRTAKEEIMMSSFRLVLRAGPTTGKAFPLEKEEMFIGREANNDVVINDPEVSRRHARLFVQGGNMILEDLGSTNGTSVNGQRLTGPYVLRAGEIITLGEKITLLFESAAVDDNATMAASRISSQPKYPPQAPQPPQVYQTPAAQQPVYAPPPAPRYQAPPPPPAFSGQIPASPQPVKPARKNTTIWIVVVIVVLLFLICACAGIIYYIDANSLWCSLPVPRSIFQGCP